MQDLKAVYNEIQTKKKERRDLAKMFKDQLAHNGEYQQILDELKRLKEKKKSIETQAKAEALSDVRQMEALAEDIKGRNEVLADIALIKFLNREQVEIVDEENDVRLVPVFAVRFRKEEGESYLRKAEAERAESHPDRMFAPMAIAQDVARKDEQE